MDDAISKVLLRKINYLLHELFKEKVMILDLPGMFRKCPYHFVANKYH
jgi:hypothetical protein